MLHDGKLDEGGSVKVCNVTEPFKAKELQNTETQHCVMCFLIW